MAKYKSIDDYRKRKKLKDVMRTAITLIIVLAILFVLASVLQLFNGTKLKEIVGETEDGESNSFPVVIKDEQLLDIFSLNNGVTVLTKGNLISYMSNGKRSVKAPHGFTNPIVEEGNKRLLTYDRGGYNFRVDTNSDTVGEKKLENQIVSAQIASNGYVGVITNHNQYASVITVYDNKLNEVYKYSSSERLTLIAFAPDNRSVITTGVATNSGSLSAIVLELNITSKEDVKRTIVQDILPLETTYTVDGKVIIVGSSEVVTFDSSGGDFKRYNIRGPLQKFTSASSNETVLVTENLVNGTSIITVLAADGITANSFKLSDTAKDVHCDGSRIVVLGVEAVYNFDMTLMLLNTIPLDNPYNKLVLNGSNVYVMSLDTIIKESID